MESVALASSAIFSPIAGLFVLVCLVSIILSVTYRRLKHIALYRQICRETMSMYYNPSSLRGGWQQPHLLSRTMRSEKDVLRLAQNRLDSLQDRHTYVLSRREVEIEASHYATEYSGIGVEIEFSKPYPLVKGVFDGSPAQEHGLEKGDLITDIDGRSTRDLPAELVREMLIGGSSTGLTLTTEKFAVRKTHRLVRKAVYMPAVTVKTLKDGIGYLKIRHFGGEETAIQALHALNQIKQTRAIVIDLRDNPGGQMRTAMQIISLFLETGLIATVRQRLPGDPVSPIYHTMVFKLAANAIELEGSSSIPVGFARDIKPRLPNLTMGKQLVVLVNEASASASELLAGCLKDHKAATIIGTTTYGKGTGQSVVTLRGGAQLTITTMQFFTPSGLCPGDGSGSGPGIVPHIVVGKNATGGDGAEVDAQLQQALRHLRGKSTYHSLQAPLAADVSLARIFSLLGK